MYVHQLPTVGTLVPGHGHYLDTGNGVVLRTADDQHPFYHKGTQGTNIANPEVHALSQPLPLDWDQKRIRNIHCRT